MAPGLFEAEVQFEIVEPGDFGIDFLGVQLDRQMFVMLAQPLPVGGIMAGDDDGVVLHAHIACQAAENILRQMGGIPGGEGRAQALPELMDCRLGHQGQRHVPVTNVQVEGARPLPAQSLVEFEKLLDMPALRIMDAQVGDLGTGRGGQEGFIMKVLRSFTRSLDDFVERAGRAAAPAKKAVWWWQSRPNAG